MDRWDLGYEELRKLRNDIIMVRLPGFGLAGPYKDYVGLAAVAMAVTGMYHLWSYPDASEPAGPPVWAPDYLSAAFGGVALLSALRDRDATGEGQLVELSQMDATAFVMGATYLDYFHKRSRPRARGKRTSASCSHTAFFAAQERTNGAQSPFRIKMSGPLSAGPWDRQGGRMIPHSPREKTVYATVTGWTDSLKIGRSSIRLATLWTPCRSAEFPPRRSRMELSFLTIHTSETGHSLQPLTIPLQAP